MVTVVLRFLGTQICQTHVLRQVQLLRPRMLRWVASLDYSVDQQQKEKQLLHGMLQKKKEHFKESGQFLLKDIKETRDKVKEKMEEIIELDGWIARNFESQASKMGSFLDPMADKVLIATLFIALTYMDLIPVYLTGAIITRDFLLVTAAFCVRYKSLPPPRTLSRYFDVTHATAQLSPTAISKWNTGMQLVLVATTLAAPVFGYMDHPVLHVMWYATASTTLASAMSYLISRNTYRFLKPRK